MAAILVPGEKVEYDMDTSGGLMEEIQALIAPPISEETRKRMIPIRESVYKRHPGRAVNRDCCDGCGEGGDLLCCDRCPASFHLSCCDPPLEDEDVPTGEWICRECNYALASQREAKENKEKLEIKSKSEQKLSQYSSILGNCSIVGAEKNSDKSSSRSSSPVDSESELNPFEKLIALFRYKNPTEFKLPEPMQKYVVVAGDRKRNKNGEAKKSKPVDGAVVTKDLNPINPPDEEVRRMCFVCSRSKRVGELQHCDFCPLVFHLDCLSPPLTQEPAGMWMCPNHPEHFEPRLKSSKFSKRAELIEDLRGTVFQNAIKLEFFRQAKKQRILMNRRNNQPKKRRACVVPDIVKAQYAHPPAVEIPNFIQAMGQELPKYLRPLALPTADEKEQWLRAVVDLQCSIATELEKPKQSQATGGGNVNSSYQKNGQVKATDNEKKISDESQDQDIKQEGFDNKVPDTDSPQSLEDTDSSSVKSSHSAISPSGQMPPSPLSAPLAVSSSANSASSSPAKIIILAAQSSSMSTSTSKSVPITTVASKPAVSAVSSSVTSSGIGRPVPTVAPKVNTSPTTASSHMVSSISTEILKDPTLSQLDDRLVRILAFQRLQQLVDKKGQHIPKISKPGITEKKSYLQITETNEAIAVFSPLNGQGPACLMRHKSFSAGQGADMDLCLANYGFCNYVSGKHATVFYDEETHQFELLNYSEHGTIVDNVLYSCDFSEKPKQHVHSSSSKFSPTSKYVEPQRKKKPPIGRTTRGLGTEFITRGCNCRASASSLIGGSGAGWEGTAVLHHGSYVKFGCMHFVFSIVECASKQFPNK